jgi:benzoyl-CoA reductase subunit C
MHIPEEVIHASGMLPVVVLASDEGTALADTRLQVIVCSVVRSALDMGMRGHLDFLAGVAFADTCDSLQAISEVWRKNCQPRFLHFVGLPLQLHRSSAVTFLREQLQRLAHSLEAIGGRPVTEEALRASIAVYEENRGLMRRLYRLRRGNPSLLRAEDMLNVSVAAMTMPKERHSAWLRDLLASLEIQAGHSEDGGDRVRLVLSGSLCDNPDADLVRLVEELGAVVVDDDLYTGGRYFAGAVPANGHPLDGIAARYLSMPPCPTKHDPRRDLGDYLVGLAREGRAHGIVVLQVKFCEPHAFDCPHLRRQFEAAGLPYLIVETEQEGGAIGQIRTRLQAFIETIGG